MLTGGLSYDHKFSVSGKPIKDELVRTPPRARVHPPRPSISANPRVVINALAATALNVARAPLPPSSAIIRRPVPTPPSSSTQTIKAEAVSKGTDFSGDGTATYVVDKELSAELKVTDKGVAKVSVTKSGLVDGLKTVASVNPSDVAKSLKLANTLLSGDVGVKADVSNCLGGNPKVEASACLNLGDAQVRTTTPPSRGTFLVFFSPNCRQTVAKPSPNARSTIPNIE